MIRLFSTFVLHLKSLTAAKPVPCWTEYLREQGGFRG